MFSCETVQYKEKLFVHLNSEESEWNMLQLIGEECLVKDKKGTLISEDIKEKCRKELLQVCSKGV